MPRKNTAPNAETDKEMNPVANEDGNQGEVDNLNRMLASVLTYISDDEVEEIDIEYLLTNTEGLREWWEKYRERNRKLIEDEIKDSLEGLSLEELESIREHIKEKKE